MPNYCKVEDVNRYVPQQPFDSDSVPSAELVAVYIENITDEVNYTLSNLGYTTPVTAPAAALRELRNAVAYGALGLAQDARMTAVLPDGQVGSKNPWTQRYRDWLKKLQDPKDPYELTDAARTSSAVVKPLGSLQSSTDRQAELPDGSTFDYLSSPPFKMGMKF